MRFAITAEVEFRRDLQVEVILNVFRVNNRRFIVVFLTVSKVEVVGW